MKNKSLIYDISGIKIKDDVSLMKQLYLDKSIPNVIKLYGEAGKSVIRSLCLPLDHDNHLASKNNQESCYIVADDSLIAVYVDLGKLVEYELDDQGSAKWIGILIDTGADTVVGLTYNGEVLDEADEAESSFVGGSAGTLVLWIKAEELLDVTKTITIGDSYGTKAKKVKVYNIGK